MFFFLSLSKKGKYQSLFYFFIFLFFIFLATNIKFIVMRKTVDLILGYNISSRICVFPSVG